MRIPLAGRGEGVIYIKILPVSVYYSMQVCFRWIVLKNIYQYWIYFCLDNVHCTRTVSQSENIGFVIIHRFFHNKKCHDYLTVYVFLIFSPDNVPFSSICDVSVTPFLSILWTYFELVLRSNPFTNPVLFNVFSHKTQVLIEMKSIVYAWWNPLVWLLDFKKNGLHFLSHLKESYLR